jgi:hypothetical protein
MKRKEESSIILGNPYQQHYFELNFANGLMLIKKRMQDEADTAVSLLMIRSCCELEAEALRHKRGDTISREQTCTWLFGFMVETHERNY